MSDQYEDARRAVAGQRWDYAFSVREGAGADPALAVLMMIITGPTLIMTFSVAQFAAFGKGLEKHGIELTEVTRRAHPEATR